VVVVVAAMALLSAACSQRSTGDRPFVDEAFYRKEFRLEPGQRGRLLASQVPDGIPKGLVGWRILYQSVDVSGRPTVVSGMALRPDRAQPAGGWPLIAYAHGTTGIADGCAPSRNPSALALVQDLLAAGYAVVETDYVGLGTRGVHPYLDGGTEGRAVLDSIRAARELPDLHAGGRAVIWGYSQGGHAALFAGQIAVTEGADLGIVAVVDQAGPSRAKFALDGRRASGAYEFFLLTAVAASRTRSGLALGDVVGPGGVAVAPDIVADGSPDCPDFGALANGVPADQRVSDPVANHPGWLAAFAALELPAAGAIAPTYIQHGTADTTVKFSESTNARARLCAGGTIVTFHGQVGGIHLTAVDPKPPLAWLDDLNSGKAPPDDCP